MPVWALQVPVAVISSWFCARARLANSWTSAVLPLPGSPDTKQT